MDDVEIEDCVCLKEVRTVFDCDTMLMCGHEKNNLAYSLSRVPPAMTARYPSVPIRRTKVIVINTVIVDIILPVR